MYMSMPALTPAATFSTTVEVPGLDVIDAVVIGDHEGTGCMHADFLLPMNSAAALRRR
jgi:hypothetical protein